MTLIAFKPELENQRRYEATVRLFPYEYAMPKDNHAHSLSPARFKRDYPTIDFRWMPIKDMATWLFANPWHVDVFKRWVKRNGGVTSDHYQH